jgi:hypothetical protein
MITATVNNEIESIRKYSLNNDENQQNAKHRQSIFSDFDYISCDSLAEILSESSDSQVHIFDIFLF